MTDLFLEPKVLDYTKDRYELIQMTLKWARAMKAKGTPEPMPVLVEKALRDIVDQKITIEEIKANKTVAEPVVAEEIPEVVSVAGDGKVELAPDVSEDDDKKKKKKKKKDE